MYKDGELFSDLMFPFAYTDVYSGELIDTNFGKNMWVPINTAIKNESAKFDSLQCLPKILKAIKEGKIKNLPFIFEENIQCDTIAEL